MKKGTFKEKYCWVIVFCASIAAFCSNGITVNCFSINLAFIRNMWGYTNSQLALFNTIRSVSGFVGVLLMGWIFRKLNFRLGISLFCAINGVGYLVLSKGTSIGVLYAAGVIMGFSISLFSIPIASMVIKRWFSDRLGFAMGIFSCSSGVATLIAPTIMTKLTENHSLPFNFTCIGFFIIAMAVVMFIFLRSNPSDMGLEPYTEKKAPVPELSGEKKASRIRIVPNGPLSNSNWILFAFCNFFMGFGSGPALSNLSMHFSDCGFTSAQTAFSISMYGICIGFAKIIYGGFVDKVGGKKSTVLFGSMLVAGFGLTCFLKALPYYPLQILSTSLTGAGYTAFSIGAGIWASEFNTVENYDETIRRLQITSMIGGVIGSFVPGVLADRFGSYIPSFALSSASCALFLIAIVIIYNRNSHIETPEEASARLAKLSAE